MKTNNSLLFFKNKKFKEITSIFLLLFLGITISFFTLLVTDINTLLFFKKISILFFIIILIFQKYSQKKFNFTKILYFLAGFIIFPYLFIILFYFSLNILIYNF